ncbi:hypothetical protein [Actinoplanes nipponensis]|uniref:hypothetical protein n=1 Tax=Actinoplanes nipponensis TaxID=135950 RepID=UPI0031E4FC28
MTTRILAKYDWVLAGGFRRCNLAAWSGQSTTWSSSREVAHSPCTENRTVKSGRTSRMA